MQSKDALRFLSLTIITCALAFAISAIGYAQAKLCVTSADCIGTSPPPMTNGFSCSAVPPPNFRPPGLKPTDACNKVPAPYTCQCVSQTVGKYCQAATVAVCDWYIQYNHAWYCTGDTVYHPCN